MRAWLLALSLLLQAEDPRELWLAGRTDDAIARAHEVLADDPSDAATREQLLSWLVLFQQYAAALEVLGPPGTELDDDWRGRILIGLGRYEEALDFLGTQPLTAAVARLNCLHALGRLDDVRAELAAAHAQESSEPRLAYWRGRLEASDGEHARAVASFREALAGDPLHMGALFGLGQSLLRSGEREEGRQVLRRHRALVPIVDRYDFAVQSLSIAPTHAPNLAQVAGLEAELGRVDLARERYAAACRLATAANAVPIVLRAARFHEQQLGETSRAVELLVEGAERFPDARLWVRAADVSARAERWEDARRYLLAAKSLRPDDPAVLQRLREAESHLESGE